MRREYEQITENGTLLFHTPLLTDLDERVNSLTGTAGSRATYSFGADGMTFTTTGNNGTGGNVPYFTMPQAFRDNMNQFSQFLMECDVKMTANYGCCVLYCRGNNNKYCAILLMVDNSLPLNTDIHLVTTYDWNKSARTALVNRYAYYGGNEVVLQRNNSRNVANECSPAQINNIYMNCNTASGSTSYTLSGVAKNVKIWGL